MSGNHEVFDNRELLIKQQFYNTVSYLPLGELSEIRDGETVSKVLENTEEHIKTMEEGPAKKEAVSTLHSLRNIPVNTWSGAGRSSFHQSILAWLLRMEKLELELLHTIIIIHYSGGESNALRKCSDGYVDIII